MEQMVLEPEPEPAGADHALRPVCEREIARDRAEREAEAIERGNREIVLAFQRDVDRTSGVEGKSVSVRVDLGGGRYLTSTTNNWSIMCNDCSDLHRSR